ncbi:MAG: DUF4783 domain-containing protein [Rubricoccaceae bacterium]|nr:DUF4783 domain-containing protein [Rubricoccaceae bacterium]
MQLSTLYSLSAATFRSAVIVAVGIAAISSTTAVAQPKSQADSSLYLRQVATALQTGESDAFLSGPSGRIELLLNGHGDTYSFGQARHVLREFFQSYPAERVSLSYGRTDDGLTFLYGRYWLLGAGSPLAVSVVIRLHDDEISAVERLRISESAFRGDRLNR